MKHNTPTYISKDLKVPTIVLIVLIIVSIISYSFYIDIINMQTTLENNKKESSRLEFLAVKGTLNADVDKAKTQTNLVAEMITKDILREYNGNDKQLKQDFASLNPNAKLYKIIQNDTLDKYINKNTQVNKICVMSNNKIISSSFMLNSSFTRGESVYKFFSVNSNDLSIEKIIKRTNDYVILGNKSVTDIDSLETIYRNNGLPGLYNLKILVPIYITDNGDILGVTDLDPTGVPQTNNKMVVIQQFSICDALSHQNYIISAFRQNQVQVQNQYIDKMRIEYFRCYMILALVIIVALLSSNLTIHTQIDDDNNI